MNNQKEADSCGGLVNVLLSYRHTFDDVSLPMCIQRPLARVPGLYQSGSIGETFLLIRIASKLRKRKG